MDIVIGIGEYAISNSSVDVLKTFSLASCVAVSFYCATKKIAGMIHIALPSHNEDREIPKKPAYYASLGLPIIIEKLTQEYGCLKSELTAQLFGGASSINRNDYFKIGIQNIKAIQNILSELNITVSASEVGGFISRSIAMEVSSGNISISTQPIKIWGGKINV